MYFFAALRAGKLGREGRLIHVIPAKIPFLVRAKVHITGNLFPAFCAFIAHGRASLIPKWTEIAAIRVLMFCQIDITVVTLFARIGLYTLVRISGSYQRSPCRSFL